LSRQAGRPHQWLAVPFLRLAEAWDFIRFAPSLR
jgi:hypothetical protein